MANHERPERVSGTVFDCLGAVTIAHALLAEIRPDDVPSYQRHAPAFDQRFLHTLGFPHSWDAWLARADALLATDGADAH